MNKILAYIGATVLSLSSAGTFFYCLVKYLLGDSGVWERCERLAVVGSSLGLALLMVSFMLFIVTFEVNDDK